MRSARASCGPPRALKRSRLGVRDHGELPGCTRDVERPNLGIHYTLLVGAQARFELV